MKIRISNIKMPLEHSIDEVFAKAHKMLRIPVGSLKDAQIIRQSVDAREKSRIVFVYTVEAETSIFQGALPSNVCEIENNKVELIRGIEKLDHPPVIVGAGPAGLFAAWKLAEWGYKPLVIERGRDVITRQADVERFWKTGELDPNSNVQFGEGGAGTFSDGKLTTRTKDNRISEVFDILVACGAPPEILYLHKPHIGTNILRDVVQNLRNAILERGGKIIFNSCLTDILINQQRLCGININTKTDLSTQICVLATGHSARDTYAMLEKRKITMQAKAFAVGLRVEHKQDFINKSQHGAAAGHSALGSADYALTHQDTVAGRGIFSFCMCPGGQVVAAASEKGGVVTNGMSEHARASGVANSAVVVSVSPLDYPNDDVLAGIDFQRILERQAYKLGGGNYIAPASDVKAFINDEAELSQTNDLYPTYLPGVEKANLRELFPKDIGTALAGAFKNFERKIPRFSENAVLTGVESRTSAPVRIIRNEGMQSLDVYGLYPVGEGAGYAGGIVSAAVDGLKAAEKIFTNFNIPLADFSQDDLTKIREMN